MSGEMNHPECDPAERKGLPAFEPSMDLYPEEVLMNSVLRSDHGLEHLITPNYSVVTAFEVLSLVFMDPHFCSGNNFQYFGEAPNMIQMSMGHYDSLDLVEGDPATLQALKLVRPHLHEPAIDQGEIV